MDVRRLAIFSSTQLILLADSYKLGADCSKKEVQELIEELDVRGMVKTCRELKEVMPND